MQKLFYITLMSFLFCCNTRKVNTEQQNLFFLPGELSKDEWVDSVRNARFTEELLSIKERPFRQLPSQEYTIRLLTSPSFSPFYCIVINKLDSVYSVTMKVQGDEENEDFMNFGVKELTLTYKSDHEKMDSLINLVHLKLADYDFNPGFDNANFTAADGTSYLLELNKDNYYKVVLGWDGGEYKGKDRLMAIVKSIHNFIPSGLIPERNEPSRQNNLFSIFHRESVK